MRETFLWLLRLGLGALFIVAGALKLGDPAGFANDITNYRFLPALAPWLAVALPAVEMVLGAALVLLGTSWRRAAALAATGLLAVFTAAVAQALARGINVSCGCFGGSSSPVTILTVARDLALLAAAATLFVLTPTAPRQDRLRSSQ